jgi:hypothetical protein
VKAIAAKRLGLQCGGVGADGGQGEVCRAAGHAIGAKANKGEMKW